MMLRIPLLQRLNLPRLAKRQTFFRHLATAARRSGCVLAASPSSARISAFAVPPLSATRTPSSVSVHSAKVSHPRVFARGSVDGSFADVASAATTSPSPARSTAAAPSECFAIDAKNPAAAI